ncbi:MAG: hypothetical protein IPJ85_05250 [Flavobacteriales bacterium]|nr:hypothetical protein [Flavobacteriales bacterium]
MTLGTSTPGSYTVTYTVAAYGTCPQYQTTASIAVSAVPVAGALSGTPQGICVGGTTTYTISGNSAAGIWGTQNPAVATVVNGVVTGIGVGTTNITYTVASAGCNDATATRSVTVTAAPVAGTLSGTPQGICIGGTTTYTISGNSAAGTWGTDNASVATVVNGVVTGQGAGTTNITYTVAGAGGCGPVSASRSVTVTAPSVAGSDQRHASEHLHRRHDHYTISGNSAAGTWGTDNASVATVVNGVVTGQGAGTTNITYTVAGTGGCGPASASRSVTVTAPSVAGTHQRHASGHLHRRHDLPDQRQQRCRHLGHG